MVEKINLPGQENNIKKQEFSEEKDVLAKTKIEKAQEIIKNLQKIAFENKYSEEAKITCLKFVDPLLVSEQEAILLNKVQNIKTKEDYENFRKEYRSISFPENTNKHSCNFMQFVINRAAGKLAEILKKEKNK